MQFFVQVNNWKPSALGSCDQIVHFFFINNNLDVTFKGYLAVIYLKGKSSMNITEMMVAAACAQ